MQAAFVQWLRDKGGYVNPKIDLFHQLKSGDRGVYAEQDIKEGEQLLLVPVQATLHLDVNDITKTDSKVPATCRPQIAGFFQQQQQRQPFSSFISTTLMLMAELATAADSDFQPYFGTLPETTDCLINWSEEDKQLLAGTSLETSGRSIDDIFTSDILPRLQDHPQLFPAASLSCEAFKHAAELVQTRAFHMKADNWLTGASQESTDELYLIPAIDMLNHSTDPSQRNTSLALVRSEVEITLENGEKRKFKDFFSMKAECDIPAGTQVLHTYGDLSDAQLLQTYGFIDAPPPAATAAAAAAASKKSKKHKKDSSSSSSSGAAAVVEGFSNPHNYVVLPMGVLLDAVKVVAAAASLWPAKKAKELLSSKLLYLSQCGLPPADRPEESQLAITAAAPLPDDLLNIVQVLMMTEEEFQQLQQADQEEQQQAAAGAAAGSSEAAGTDASAPAAAAAAKPVGLDLGRELLQGEFGELCATVLLQAVGSCLKRLPPDAASGASLMAVVAPGSRAGLAAAVAAGDEQQWQQIKKAALVLMLEVTQGGDDDEEDEDEDEDEDDSEFDSELDDDDDSEDLEEAEEEAPKGARSAPRRAKHARTTKQQQQQQQPAKKQKTGSTKAATAADKQHSSKHKKHQKHKRDKSQATDSRPHYGDMTGPDEENMWQSDDSDKVGYSSDEDADAAAAAGGSSKKAPRQRHLIDGCEVHTYEVGGSGAVREVHGHMVGPDEADLIESDDSDKVGYCDAGSSGDEQKAAAAAGGSSKGKRSRGASKSSSPAAAAEAKSNSSKKPKKGLGYKG